MHLIRRQVVSLALLMALSTIAILLPGNASATASGSVTTSKGTPPTTYSDWEAGWMKCTWNNLYYSSQGEDLGDPTVVCFFDGAAVYSSTSSIDGSATHNWAGFELAPGTHTLRIQYSTGWNARFHYYIYAYADGTLTVSCASLTATVRFEIYQGLGKITLDGTIYSNWDTATVAAGCRNTHTINSTVNAGYTFSQWAANHGFLVSVTAHPTTFYVDSRYTNTLAMIISDNTLSNWGGYIASSSGTTLSFTSAYGRFTLPTNAAYVSTPSPDIEGIWVGLGGVANTNLWQAGVALNVTSGGTGSFTP